MNTLLLIAAAAAAVFFLRKNKEGNAQTPEVEEEIIPPLSFDIVWNEKTNRNPAGGQVYYQTGKLIVTNNSNMTVETQLSVGYPDRVRGQMGHRVIRQQQPSSFSITINNDGGIVLAPGEVLEVPISFQGIRMLGGTIMFTNVYGAWTFDFYIRFDFNGYAYNEFIETTTPEIAQ